MDMQGHILAALNEQFNRWEELLSRLSEAQITTRQPPSGLPVKDVLAHLWAWQQRTIARLEAAHQDREPAFPQWLPEVDPDTEQSLHATNAWIYAAYREKPWPEVYADWRAGYLRFIELGAGISERDLLDSSRYPWLQGYNLAFILLASYDHHQEHYEQLDGWLEA